MDSAAAKEANPTILLLKKPFTDRQLLRMVQHLLPG